MILTCPSCGTQYVVKDGAIPSQGRQVRCASCKHSWHQDPETAPEERAYLEAGLEPDEPVQEAEILQSDAAADDIAPVEDSDLPSDYAPLDPVAPPAEALVEDAPAAAAP